MYSKLSNFVEVSFVCLAFDFCRFCMVILWKWYENCW